ncbi:unnamed protein product [Diamesa serratosioi]
MNSKVITLTLLLWIVVLSSGANVFDLSFRQSTVKVVVTDHFYMLDYVIIRDDRKIQSVTVGTGAGGFIKSRKTDRGFILYGRGDEIEFAVEVDERDYSQFSISRRNIRKSANDCINLEGKSKVNWYGGNQQREQYYPIQNITHKHASYVTKELYNMAIAERYWLNSNGVYFFVNPDVPLFIDQNNEFIGYMCLQAKRSLPYDTYHATFDFTYHVGIAINARQAHLQAIQRFLKKPAGHPDEMMVRQPVWSTWARYKAAVNEKVVIEFANEILENGFTGQFELDDDWEKCYGALEFNTVKFPNIKELTDSLKAQGFRVTLWIHPFINKPCEPYYSEAKDKGYFVKSHAGSVDTQWWNSQPGQASYVDFTKTAAAQWFSNRLKLLQTNAGIDSFKFDAGESSWTPEDPVLNATYKEIPHKITIDYVKTVSKFGSLVEVRSGQFTQDLPVFVRMIDKDSVWTMNNGLPTLITTLLQLNMAGYPLVLPDMIGGNGYGASLVESVPPTEELFLRWLQANTFMPSLQFSYVPWDYSTDAITISRKFTQLHDKYTELIMERFKLAVSTGEPVNPPIWWIAPEDKIAQEISDEFLLGEKILVAPVVEQGKLQRDIYLPAGTWEDGNTGELHKTTGKWLRNYLAPLDTLPYFIKN